MSYLSYQLLCPCNSRCEKVAQNAALLASQQKYVVMKHQLNNYSSYTVNLVWLKSSTTESQQLQYFQSVFLIILNMRFLQRQSHKLSITQLCLCYIHLILYTCSCDSSCKYCPLTNSHGSQRLFTISLDHVILRMLFICDWICENCPYWHNN